MTFPRSYSTQPGKPGESSELISGPASSHSSGWGGQRARPGIYYSSLTQAVVINSVSTTHLLSMKDGLITPCSPGLYILQRKKINKVTDKRIPVCDRSSEGNQQGAVTVIRREQGR